MRLVDRHIIKDNRFEDICLKSGLLYNYVLYLVRQGIFNKEYLKEYDLSTKLGRENLFDFRQLPASVSQQVVGQVFKSVNSWIKLISIDLGLNNLCSCISNVGIKPFIINGKVIKSLNRWYNKKKARLMSYVGDNGTSRRIRRISLYRNCWIDDKMHKISKYIVNFCVSNNIGRIIIGLNKEWKQEINIGRRNNQHFVSIPHSKLIDKIMYKAKLLGIKVVTHEESYTSKIDHLAFEEMKYQDNYLGKRKRRGLFQSSIGKLINADINGAIGIARKVVGDSCINTIVSSGFAFNPIRLNIL